MILSIEFRIIKLFQIVASEDFPALICGECVESIHKAEELRKNIIKSDKYFQTLRHQKALNQIEDFCEIKRSKGLKSKIATLTVVESDVKSSAMRKT